MWNLTCFRYFLLLDSCTKLPHLRRLLVSRLDVVRLALFGENEMMLNLLSSFITCQALVQFSDVETASVARTSLDGRSIPRHAQFLYACLRATVFYSSIDHFFSFFHTLKNFRYLLPDHVVSCNLRMSYSAHTDLNIKFQSHRSR